MNELIKSLISVLKNPYKRRAGIEKYSKPPGKNNGKYVTMIGNELKFVENIKMKMVEFEI